MALFNRSPYHTPYSGGYGAPMRRGMRLRGLLLVFAIIFGLYFLNLAFLWVSLPVMGESATKFFNVIIGVLLVLLGIMTVIRQRPY